MRTDIPTLLDADNLISCTRGSAAKRGIGSMHRSAPNVIQTLSNTVNCSDVLKKGSIGLEVYVLVCKVTLVT